MENKIKFIKGKETMGDSIGLTKEELVEMNSHMKNIARKVMTLPDYDLEDGMAELVETLSPKQMYMMAMNKFQDVIDELITQFEAFRKSRGEDTDDCQCPNCQARRAAFGPRTSSASNEETNNVDEILKHIRKEDK